MYCPKCRTRWPDGRFEPLEQAGDGWPTVRNASRFTSSACGHGPELAGTAGLQYVMRPALPLPLAGTARPKPGRLAHVS
jgi:hypothetical protein